MAVGYNPKIVTSGLIFCLDAANKKSYPGSGTTWYDLSTSKNTSTLTAGPTFSSNNGGYFTFAGGTDTVNCGAFSQVGSALTGLTVSTWIYSTSAGTAIIAENGSDFVSNTFYLAQENTTDFTFLVTDPTTATQRVAANFAYQTNTWYNLVGTWSSGNNVKIYSNGQDVSGTYLGTARTSVRDGNTSLYLASRSGNSVNFIGRIAVTKIYNRALSAIEVSQNFNALRGRFGI